MIVAIGHSIHPLVPQAVEDVLARCREQLQGLAPHFGIVFTSRMDADFQAILERITDAWPGLRLVGCTTDGEISDVYPCTEESLNLLLIHSQGISFATGVGEGVSRDPEAALRMAHEQARRDLPGEPGLGIVLCEGLKTMGVHLGEALRSVLGQEFPVFGGCAGDHYRFQTTYQFHGHQVLTDAVVLVLLSGSMHFSMRLRSGWTPVGRTFTVTDVTDNIVRRIDNLPALEFFQKHVGPHSGGYPQFPLAVLTGDGEDDFVLRDPAFINETDGSIAFVGTFPKNPRIRLTEYSREDLLLAAEWASGQALSGYPGFFAGLALLFPCTSRRRILGSRAAEEHAPLLHPADGRPAHRLFGMYAYGEIGPVGGTGRTCFHNDTYAVLLLGEEP